MEKLEYNFNMDEFLKEHPGLKPDLRAEVEPVLEDAQDATFRLIMALIYG